MRKRFDKSMAIDAASNLREETRILNHAEPYTEEEEELLRAGMMKLELFKGGAAKVKKVKSLTSAVKNTVAYKQDDPLGWGRSETLVRGTKDEVSCCGPRYGRLSAWAAERMGNFFLLLSLARSASPPIRSSFHPFLTCTRCFHRSWRTSWT